VAFTVLKNCLQAQHLGGRGMQRAQSGIMHIISEVPSKAGAAQISPAVGQKGSAGQK